MLPEHVQIINKAMIALNYFGDAIFAISGALAAGRRRLDIVGYVFIGVITGIGGGTIRDLLLNRTVWWIKEPKELLICVVAALATFFWTGQTKRGKSALIWSDALGLSAFTVVGSAVAVDSGAHVLVAVLMGMITCTGGGMIRDLLTDSRPMILRGELYAVAALAGSTIYVTMRTHGLPVPVPSICGFLATLLVRGAAIKYSIRLGPPGDFLRIGGK